MGEGGGFFFARNITVSPVTAVNKALIKNTGKYLNGMTAGYNGKIRENPGENGRVDRYGYGKDCTSVLYGLHNQIIFVFDFNSLI